MATLALEMGMYEVGVGFDYWNDVGGRAIVFSSDREDIAAPIPVGDGQSGTHLGNGTPGTDQCGGGRHGNNVQYKGPASMCFWYYSEEDISDANLANEQCTFRLHFNHASAVAVSEARLFVYDGNSYGAYAEGVTVYAFERGIGALAWTPINDGPTGLGGDYPGDRLDLQDKGTPENNHYWYIAVSLVPQEVGEFSAIGIGATALYS